MRRGVIILVLGVFVSTAMSGQLDDLEKKSKKKKSDSSSSSEIQTQSSDSASSSSYGSGTYPSSGSGESFSESFLSWLVMAPFQSWRHRDDAAPLSTDSEDEEGWAGEERVLFSKHTLGSLTMPYVRADYNWQHIDSNLKAVDLRVEAGYKVLAFYGRHTLYTESNPTAELTVNQYYGMLRFGGTLPHGEFLSGSWEAGLGLGMVQQIGVEEASSGAFTVPLKFYPTNWIGVEFRPAWYHWNDRAIGDYDLSASLGWRFVQVRGGYRWLWMQGDRKSVV